MMPVDTTQKRRILRQIPEWVDALPFLLFIVFLVMIVDAPRRINHDCAYVLQCAQILVSGGLPYVDFIDINPPLIFYMNMAPVYVARLTGVTLPQAFSLFVLGQLAASTALLRYLFRLRELNLKPMARFTLILGWILTSLFVYATGDFGQRDYLVILMAFPFVIVRIIRYYGDSVPAMPASFIGLMTGIGISLKPNFFLIVLVPELIGLLRTRRWRVLGSSEILACVLFCTLYGLHFFFLPSVVRAELFGRWVPFFIEYYGKINLNLFQYVFTQPLVIAGMVVFAAFTLLAFVIVRRRGISSLRIEMLTGLFIGSFFSYWIQQKGYSYHTLPAKTAFVMLALFASLWLYEEIMHRREYVRLRRTLAASASIFIIIGLSALTYRMFGADQRYVDYASFKPYRDAIRAHSHAKDRVLFLNTILFPAYPTLIQTERLAGSRYLASFPLAGFYYGQPPSDSFSYRARAAMSSAERRFLAELASDIEANTPALIFIHRRDRCSAMPDGFNMLEYFRRCGFITDAMHDYEAQGEVGDFMLYVRRNDAETARRIAHE